MIALILWGLCGALFFGLGIYCFFAKKQVGFWANAEVPPVTDVKAFNRAVGRLWCGFGIVFVLLGLPLATDNTILILLVSTLGTVYEVIALIVIFMCIENKYRKK